MPSNRKLPIIVMGGTMLAVALVFAVVLTLKPPRLTAPPGDGFLCEQKFTVQHDGKEATIPYCGNVDLATPQSLDRVTHVIVSIHGRSRNARHYYDCAHRVARRANRADETLIIAPQFLIPDDIVRWSLAAHYASWNNWLTGALSRKCDDCPPRLSSYGVLDQLLARLLQQFDLPDLKQITVVGNSAGGQLVNRYAASSPLIVAGTPIRYVVVSPSSYLYFSPQRPVLPVIDNFAIPGETALKTCPDYNRYRYGLKGLKRYLRSTGPDGIRQRYQRRNAYYLVGSDDNDPNHKSLSTRCAAMLQGRHRLERARAYMHHLRQEFGAAIDHQQFAVVEGLGHQACKMFTSPCGIAAIMGKTNDDCAFVAPGQ